MINMDKLDKIVKVYGFKKVKYPVGNPKLKQSVDWYVKQKVPYNSAISKPQLLEIIDTYLQKIKKK